MAQARRDEGGEVGRKQRERDFAMERGRQQAKIIRAIREREDVHPAIGKTKVEYAGPDPPYPGDDATDEQKNAWMDARQPRRERVAEWNRAHLAQVAEGKLTPEDAKKLGVDDEGVTWAPLPPKLYHVTTAAKEVREGGLKSRHQLVQEQAPSARAGLGGGTAETISFTDDPKIAADILHGLRQYHAAATGTLTVPEMIRQAEKGEGATGTWDSSLKRLYQNSWEPGQPDPIGYTEAKRGRMIVSRYEHEKYFSKGTKTDLAGAIKASDLPPHAEPDEGWLGGDGERRHISYSLPLADFPEERQREERVSFFKGFSAFREHAGGPMDPLFFLSDEHAMAKLDPKNFGIVTVVPKPKALGHQMGSLGEWRVHSPRAFDIEDISDRLLSEFHLYSPDQPREPSGTSEGGRFADAGGGSGIPSAEAMGDVTVEEHPDGELLISTPRLYARVKIEKDTAEVVMVRNRKTMAGRDAQAPEPKDFLRVMHRMIREVKARGATQIVADIVHDKLARVVEKLGGTVQRDRSGFGYATTRHVLPLDSPKLAKLAEAAAASFILLDRTQTYLAAQWGLSEWPVEWVCALVADEEGEDTDSDECHWVTLDNGAKVCIGTHTGTIKKGPQALVGQHIRDVRPPTRPPKGEGTPRSRQAPPPWVPRPEDQERQAFLDDAAQEGLARQRVLFAQAQRTPQTVSAQTWDDLPKAQQDRIKQQWKEESGGKEIPSTLPLLLNYARRKGLDQVGAATAWADFSHDEQEAIRQHWIKGAVELRPTEPQIAEKAAGLWERMSPSSRWEYAHEYELDHVPMKEPSKWSVWDNEAEGYRQTQQVARVLVRTRAADLWHTRYPNSKAPMPQWDEVGRTLWGAWKNDSNSGLALALQEAAIEEFGANNHLTPHQQETAEGALAWVTDQMNGREVAKTYLRALWETNQFLLDKAGQKEVRLYRAVVLPKPVVRKQSAVFYGGGSGERDYVALPDLKLRQNALQSTSYSRDTPNSWEGVGSSPEGGRRVVVSMTVPASAMLSLPVFGQNTQREQEVVVLGTPWKEWRAWYDKAPNLDDWELRGGPPPAVPLKDTLGDWYYKRYDKELREQAMPINQKLERVEPTDDDFVIDFSDPDQNGGLGHWLVPSSRPESTDKAELTEAARLRYGAGSPIHLIALALQQGHPHAQALLRRAQQRSQQRLLAQAEDDCHWVTLDNGAKVCIGGSGEITKGPSTLVGQNISAVRAGARGEAPQAEPRRWEDLTPQQQDTARTAYIESERPRAMESAVYQRRLEIEGRIRETLSKDKVFLLGIAQEWLNHNPELAKKLKLDAETLAAATQVDKNGLPYVSNRDLPDAQEWLVSTAKEDWPREVMRAFDDTVYRRRDATPDSELERSLEKSVLRTLGKNWETVSAEKRFEYHGTPIGGEHFDFGPVKETEAQSKADLLRTQGYGRNPLTQEANGVVVLTKRGRETEAKLRQSGTSLRELTAAFTPRFPSGGPDYETTLTIEPGYSEKTVTIHGTITDPATGQRVGSFGRSIYFDAKYAAHLEFFVEGTDAKNKGIAGLFSIATDEYYRKLGLKNVQLQAISQERNEITGHQVWPSQGFTWSERRGADMYREAFASVVAARYGADSAESKTAEAMRAREAPAWEYTAFKDRQGESIGWYLMHLEKIGRMPPFPPVQHSPAMFRPLDQPDSVAEKIWQAHVQRTLKKLGLSATAAV